MFFLLIHLPLTCGRFAPCVGFWDCTSNHGKNSMGLSGMLAKDINIFCLVETHGFRFESMITHTSRYIIPFSCARLLAQKDTIAA